MPPPTERHTTYRVPQLRSRTALTQLNYRASVIYGDIFLYFNVLFPNDPVAIDYSKGDIPDYALFSTLEWQGVNVDAFCAHLEEITIGHPPPNPANRIHWRTPLD